MKRLMLATLSTIVLTGLIAPIVRSEPVSVNSTTAQLAIAHDITPFNLVSLAQQGYLQNAGIPQQATLVNAYRLGQVNATDLVQAAVKLRQLAPDHLQDQAYLQAVDTQLHLLADIR